MSNRPFSGHRSAAKTRKINLGGRNYDSSKTNKATEEKRKARADLQLRPLTARDVPIPQWLHQEHRPLFKKVRDIVLAQGMVRNTDGFTLELLCVDYVNYHHICQIIAEEGLMVEEITATGIARQRPHHLLPLREQLRKSLGNTFRDFGMTPVSRKLVVSDVKAEEPDDPDADEWSSLVNGTSH